MNPIFSAMGGGNNLLSQFQQFKSTFSGDPQQIIQQMMQSGRVNQNMLNQAQAMARQFSGFLK